MSIPPLVFSPVTLSAPLGGQVLLEADSCATGRGPINVSDRCTFEVDDPEVLRLDGVVDKLASFTALRPGRTTVHAKLDGLEAIAAVTVLPARVVGLRVTTIADRLPTKLDLEATALASFDDGQVLDVTADTTFSAPGKRPIFWSDTPGRYTVTARYFGLEASVTVEIVDMPLAYVSVEPIDPVLKVGESQILKAYAVYEEGLRLDISRQSFYLSSAQGVASVPTRGNGEVRALSEGTSIISVIRIGLPAGIAIVRVGP